MASYISLETEEEKVERMKDLWARKEMVKKEEHFQCMDLLLKPFIYVTTILLRIRNFFFEFFEVVVVLLTGAVRYLRCHYFEEQLKKHIPKRRTQFERRKAMYQEVYNMAEG